MRVLNVPQPPTSAAHSNSRIAAYRITVAQQHKQRRISFENNEKNLYRPPQSLLILSFSLKLVLS